MYDSYRPEKSSRKVRYYSKPKYPCKFCERYGHRSRDCKGEKVPVAIQGTNWTVFDYERNRDIRCGCYIRDVEQALRNYLRKYPRGYAYNTHCCKCKSPYPMRSLVKGPTQCPYVCNIKCNVKGKFPEIESKQKETLYQTNQPDKKQIEENSNNDEQKTYTTYSWTDKKTGENHSTDEPNWEKHWPKCVECT